MHAITFAQEIQDCLDDTDVRLGVIANQSNAESARGGNPCGHENHALGTHLDPKNQNGLETVLLQDGIDLRDIHREPGLAERAQV